MQTRASERLNEWVRKDPKARTQSAIARHLEIEQPSVGRWLDHKCRPEPHLRIAVQRMTRGYVQAADWMTDDEAQIARDARPMPAPVAGEG